MIADADIAWVDMHPTSLMADAIRAAATTLQWVSTIYAGLDAFPLDLLRERGATLTNGAGVNAHAVAEYARDGRARRRQALRRGRPRARPPRMAERCAGQASSCSGTRALVIGYGTIGRLIGDRLAAFGVEVTGVTRSGRERHADARRWRGGSATFDWVILAAPSTGETKAMIGASELAAMKPSAWLINIARGDMIDEDALVAALKHGRIAGAFLDPTNPEPLPAEHPLWNAPNAIITMHLSGRSQTQMFRRAAALFLDNLHAFLAGAADEQRRRSRRRLLTWRSNALPARYHAFVDWIGDGTGLPDTILHIHAGMLVLMLARVATGRSLGSLVPLAVVVAAEAFNEIMDRLLFGSWRWADTSLDIANTLLWPTVICLGIRLRPLAAARRRKA